MAESNDGAILDGDPRRASTELGAAQLPLTIVTHHPNNPRVARLGDISQPSPDTSRPATPNSDSRSSGNASFPSTTAPDLRATDVGGRASTPLLPTNSASKLAGDGIAPSGLLRRQICLGSDDESTIVLLEQAITDVDDLLEQGANRKKELFNILHLVQDATVDIEIYEHKSTRVRICKDRIEGSKTLAASTEESAPLEAPVVYVGDAPEPQSDASGSSTVANVEEMTPHISGYNVIWNIL